jgi:hypothetical protein
MLDLRQSAKGQRMKAEGKLMSLLTGYAAQEQFALQRDERITTN